MDLEEKAQGDLTKRVEEFLRVFKKGEEFTQELLKENERLRYKILHLEDAARSALKGKGAEETGYLWKLIEDLEKEKKFLTDRMKEVEQENKDFVNKYVEVEEENNNLANLYVASYQLHSTLDFQEVVRIIMEIIINLIGSDRFSLYLLDEAAEELQAVVSEGMEEKMLFPIKVGEGIIGSVARTGESHFESDSAQEDRQEDRNVHSTSPHHPLVCIPLMIKERIIGVIAIFSLLEQKKALTRVDYELFSMLAGHSATAIFSAKLYSQSERRLSTIQGFIDLLSGKAG